MPGHVGIVACSPTGAAFCYQLSASERDAPQISVHAEQFAAYSIFIDARDWKGISRLMLSSAEKLSTIGAEFVISLCNAVHHALAGVIAVSPLRWLSIVSEVLSEVKRCGYRCVCVLGTKVTMESELYRPLFAGAGVHSSIPCPEECDELNRLFRLNGQGAIYEARSIVCDQSDKATAR